MAAILLLACAVSGQWNNANQADIARQYQSQDGSGQATFGYSHPGQSADTLREADGSQRGSYAYINPEGREIRVNFIADVNGFRVDNDHTQETAEVAAARAAHMAAHTAALAAANAASPNEQWETPQTKPVTRTQTATWTAPVQQQTWTAPVQQQTWTAPQQTWIGGETPEVAAARAAHIAAHNAVLAASKKISPTQNTWDAPQTKTAPIQQQTWTAPVQQQTWTAPQQKTWTAPQQNWITPEQHMSYRPQSVQDTPDVAAARAAHLAAHTAALAAAKAASPTQGSWDTPQTINIPQQKTWTAPVQQQTWAAPVQQQTWTAPVEQRWNTWVPTASNPLPEPVQDTPEVQAAKAEFYRSYNAAAAVVAQTL